MHLVFEVFFQVYLILEKCISLAEEETLQVSNQKSRKVAEHKADQKLLAKF